MVHHTRLDCAIGSAGGMRRALSVALNHTATRRAFGATLLEQVTKRSPLSLRVVFERDLEHLEHLEHLGTTDHGFSLSVHCCRAPLYTLLSSSFKPNPGNAHNRPVTLLE